MKASLKKIKDCRVKLFVEVEPELVEGRYQEVLKSFQAAARIPGFREGRAPADLVEKKYFKEAQEELLKSLIPEAYHRTLATQKVAAVTLPSISEIQFERGKKLTFTAEFEQQPEFSLKNYKGIKLKREVPAVLEEDVEKAVQTLLEYKTAATKLPAVLDDEFAKSFGKENVAQLREAVRKDVASHRQSESFEKMKTELFQKLLLMTSVTLPEGLVKKQKEILMAQAQRVRRTLEDAEGLERARDQVKLYFILQKIADMEKIEVDEIELEKRLQALVEQSGRSIEEVRHSFEEELRTSLLEKKTIDFLIANAKFEEKSG